MRACPSPLNRFIGDSLVPKGMIDRPVTLGMEPKIRTVMAGFLVVDCLTTYNVILGRPILDDLSTVTSVCCQAMKFPTPQEVAMIRSYIKESWECYNWAIHTAKKWPLSRIMVIAESKPNPGPLKDIIDYHIHRKEPTIGPTEELREISVNEEDPTRVLKINNSLSGEMVDNLVGFLKKNLDVFVWAHVDMVGINPKGSQMPGLARQLGPGQEVEWQMVMSFGLKNSGETYQRLVNKMFTNQIGKTIEVRMGIFEQMRTKLVICDSEVS
ncbi:uncharacterized protein LOC116130567 [Pistacia vera]|uniref:uncharacterized protein LOC116130567 n=1 Tax=Pistacia vera TaxID=55513 RepID=UPI0012638460|nr:uncharacterized protein LOC116130567 [Pistacia vera]